MRVTVWDIDCRDMPRWFRFDPMLRRPIRRLLDQRRSIRPSGLSKVSRNLQLGLAKIGVSAEWVTAIRRPPSGGAWGIVNGPLALLGAPMQVRPSVTGPGVLTWPTECPDLFGATQVRKHLAASEWIARLYRAHYGDRIGVWPVGIETDRFVPSVKTRPFSLLVYDKVEMYLDKVPEVVGLSKHVCSVLDDLRIPYTLVRYGTYSESEYMKILDGVHAVVILSQHETQGIAQLEAMSCDLPVLAWNPGRVLEENWKRVADIWPLPASAIPYFSPECGDSFPDAASFRAKVIAFKTACERGAYRPRDYVVRNLSLEAAARHYIEQISCSAI